MTDPISKKPNIRLRPRATADNPPTVTANPPAAAAEYVVGYGKPPVGHRFKPGRSGNPKGRPRGAKGVNTIVRELLEQKVEMQIRGRVRKVSRLQALLMKQMELSAKGDPRSTALLVNSYRQAVPDCTAATQSDQHPKATQELSATEQAMLEMFAEEVRAEILAPADKKGGVQ